MQFEATSDQRLIQASVRGFVENEVVPRAREADEREAPVAAWLEGLGGLGLLGMFVPTELGGAGLDLVSAAIAVEEIARGSAALATTVVVHNALALPALARGAPFSEQVSTLTSGARLAGWGAPARGALDVTAEPTPGGWRLRGRRAWTWQGGQGDPLVLVAAAPAGPTAFVLEASEVGLKRTPVRGRLGLRAADVADLELDVVLADAARLGPEGEGLTDFDVARARVLLGAVAVGVLRAALEVARAYALDRKQFGRSIADFQAIQWKLADMSTELDAARLLVLSAASLEGKLDAFSAAAAKAKLFASEAASRGATQALQIHGGNGFVREVPVERFLRDAKALEVGLLASDPARRDVARSVLLG